MAMRFVPLLLALALAVAGAGVASAHPSTAPARTVKVTANDFKFVLSTKTVEHGRVKFVISNAGASEHDFLIAKHASKTIQPGQRTTLLVMLKPGRYQYRCTIDSHAELGMKGVLRVK
jgi:uncharacterized cupredoxin-like copper-binding protein